MVILLLSMAIISGVLSIERLVWGKLMLSRPIIFVPIIVLILYYFHFIPNDNRNIILVFFFMSILIELRFLFTIPVGSSFVPDTTVGAMSAFFLLYILKNKLNNGNFHSILLFFYIMVLVLSYISGYFDVLVRRFTMVLVEYGKKLLMDGEFYGFEKLSKYGYILYFLKGFFITLISGIVFVYLFKLVFPLLNKPAINRFSILFLISILSRFSVNLFVHWRIFKNSLINFFIFVFIIIAILQFKSLGIFMMFLFFIIYLLIEIKRFKNG